MALESLKNLKHLGIIVSKRFVVEESWEDEVLRKKREFNKMTRKRLYKLKGC